MAQELKPSYSFSSDRLSELAKIFPEAFEDGEINIDTLRDLIGIHSSDGSEKEHFGLNWVGKRDARRIAAKAPTGTLKPCLGEGVNEDSTENILIEGENLEVLKILRKSYAGKIKMIYIDPPYNTGNDFIYKDDFSDSTEDYLRKSGEKSEDGLLVSNPKESGRFHANWLSFMYPRLRVAKDLLKEDGLIFISIDDNELANLKSILDEIFGEENFEGIITWRRRHNQPNDKTKVIGKVAEYLVVYTKNIVELKSKSTFYGVPLSEDRINDYKNPDNDPKGKWSSNPWKAAQGRGGSSYTIVTPTGKKYDETWYGNKDSFDSLIKEKRVHWTDGGNGVPRIKIYLEDAMRDGQSAINFFTHQNFGSNQDGSAELEELFEGNKVFDNPKPTKLLSAIQQICMREKDDIFLDFFAGSGSSLASVILNNSKFKTNCKFIGIQIPEPINEKEDSGKNAIKLGYKYISEITKSRMQRTIKSINKNNEFKFGFKVYSLQKSNVFKWQDFDPEKQGGILELSSQLELSLKSPLNDGTQSSDLVTEILLQEGFPLTSSQEELKGSIVQVISKDVPYRLFISLAKKLDGSTVNNLDLKETDHFVCLDNAFGANNSLKQTLDNRCKLFTI